MKKMILTCLALGFVGSFAYGAPNISSVEPQTVTTASQGIETLNACRPEGAKCHFNSDCCQNRCTGTRCNNNAGNNAPSIDGVQPMDFSAIHAISLFKADGGGACRGEGAKCHFNSDCCQNRCTGTRCNNNAGNR